MFERKTNRIAVPLLMLVAVAGSGFGQVEYNRARYQLIVERSPFGAEAVNVAPEPSAANAPAVKQAQQQLRLCFLLKSDTTGEVRAGFQNLKASKGEPKSVILMEGESFRSMKLTRIDLEGSSATLEYNGSPVLFELTKATPAKPANKQAANQPTRRFGGGFRSRTQPETSAQPPEPELTPEERAARIAEIRAKLQEQQMDIIRKGQPPLPIPLTQDMDDQLVAEGYLPPVDEEPVE